MVVSVDSSRPVRHRRCAERVGLSLKFINIAHVLDGAEA
jgi:hypothetical protein